MFYEKIQNSYLQVAFFIVGFGEVVISRVSCHWTSIPPRGSMPLVYGIWARSSSFEAQSTLSTNKLSSLSLLTYIMGFSVVSILYLLVFGFSYYNLEKSTVELHLTTTPFIRPPRYYGHLNQVREKAWSVIFLFKEPL